MNAVTGSFSDTRGVRTVRIRVRGSALAVLGTLAGPYAFATDCRELGLSPESGAVLQLREAGQEDRSATTYRDVARGAWFVPLQSQNIGDGQTRRPGCMIDGVAYRKLAGGDPALYPDTENDVLTFLDPSLATGVIDARKVPLMPQGQSLDSAGVNYQLGLNYSSGARGSARRYRPSVYGDFYSRMHDWYFRTNLAWNGNGRVTRYESYALREWLDTGTYLRIGDSVSGPTPLGEALQFAGVSWGTDRTLRPGDYTPVLPTLRSGNAIAGPMEVFINDTLQFQKTVQNGVYDLRNLPAQQGFNSYSVRTLDALGNPVTVLREIYLPDSLLPPGIAAWRVDAGLQRENFLGSNAQYGPALVSGSYARGLTHDLTLGARGLVSKAGSILSAEYDQRMNDLWSGHLAVITARNTVQQGEALLGRLDGGSRWWRVLAEWTRAFRPLPGLGSRPALESQRLLRAQLNAVAGWTLGMTLVQSVREITGVEAVTSVNATTRVPDSAASVTLGVTRTRFLNTSQNSLLVSVFLPLAPDEHKRNQSVYLSANSGEGYSLGRAQYTNSGNSALESSWSVGSTYDARGGQSALDGYWTRSFDKVDLMASGRSGRNASSLQLSLDSGLLFTGGAMYTTRPIRGAFAMVSTSEPGVGVAYENRPVGVTDARGMLLVPDLRAFEINRLSVDPTTWPIQWTSADIEQKVVPPRGGGVLVSFRINAASWPADSMARPLAPGGRPYPAGTAVYASVNGDTREAVIDREGRVWIGDLLPASGFTITLDGKRCDFAMPSVEAGAPTATLSAQHCLDAP